ncbi:MAG: flavin reductase family protein [Acidimicrobiia bacterium]
MDQDTKKKALRSITYGLYVATAVQGEHYAAGTVNWLSQASFTPPLVMAGFRVDSGLRGVVEATGAFAINTLAAHQKDVAQAFFKPAELVDGKLNGYEFEPGPETGAPLFLDLPSWFEARVTDVVERGDHSVFVGEVVAVGVRYPEALPLAMRETGWSYGG